MLPAILLIALGGSASPRAALQSAAAASPRPVECASRAAEPELWGRARAADRRYCHTLSRGYTRLSRAPKEALAFAEQALRERPSAPSAELLRARALVSLGRARDAWAAIAPHLEGRPERPAWGIDDPEALHDVAGAAVLSGDVARGHELYRWLVARAALLSDSRERARALVEAGAAALARGAEFVSEAELYLDEARRASTPGVDALALAFQALALDRAGQPEHARALAREIADPWALERLLSERERAAVTSQIFGATEGAPVAPPPEPEGRPVFFLPSGELHAAIGVVMAGRDPKLAELHFRAFLADQRAGAGPWVEHAKKKLSLRSSARRREE